MSLLGFVAFSSMLQKESESVAAENPWVIGLIIALAGAVLIAVVGWRVWNAKRVFQQRMRAIAIVIPFVDQLAFSAKLSAILRGCGLRQKDFTGCPVLFQPSSFRKLAGMTPVSLEILGNRTAKIVGPAAIMRWVKVQFPGAEERVHPSEIPNFKPVLKFCALVILALAALATGGILMAFYFTSISMG